MRTFETDRELRGAVERALVRKIDDSLFSKSKAELHPPYSEADFKEILQTIRNRIRNGQQRDGKGRESPYGKIPKVVRAIAEEVSLWQEIRLHDLEPQIAEARARLFHTNEVLELEQANRFISTFFDSEAAKIRPAYIGLFLERRILPQDYGEYIGAMEPNDAEYFLAVTALVMNRAYLSGIEGMQYVLTGRKGVSPGIFNPAFVLMTYRLALYLQPPGRPGRSLLSARELALLRLVGTASGREKWSSLCGQWNREHPTWSYISWRLFRKAFVRAKKRLLNSYSMMFLYERMGAEDPERFWLWLEELTTKALG